MKSKIWMILVAVIIAGLTVPAFAAVESVKVGGDILIYGVYRHNLDLTKDTPSSKDQQHFFQTSTRVYVTADLTDMVSAMVRLINERNWGISDSYADGDQITLDIAYIKVADIMTPGVTLTVGRQELLIGEGLVVGSQYNAANYPDTQNPIAAIDLGLQKAFDAVRVDYEMATAPVNICVFMAKINEAIGGTGTQDTNLYGLSLLYDADNFTVEPYYVARILAFETKAIENDLMTAGVRATGEIPVFGGIALKGEFAKQFGNAEPFKAGAKYTGWAGYVGADYAFDTNMNPTLSLGYNYYSGGESSDTDQKAWVPVYPSNIADRIGALAYVANYTGGATNLQVINLGFGLQPVEKVTLALDWYNLKLNKVSSSYKKGLGNEIDLGVKYAYTEDLCFGLDVGYFMRGKYIKQTISDSANGWQAIVSMAVDF